MKGLMPFFTKKKRKVAACAASGNARASGLLLPYKALQFYEN